LDPSGTWQLAARYEKLIEQSPPMTVPQAMIESWILQLQFNVNVLVSDFDISHDDRSHDFHLLADLTTVLND
jgi:hypothetical protein